MTRILAWVGAFGLLLAACGGSSNGEGPFDFSEIAVGEAVLVPAASGTSATLTVETNLDAVCAVAFGETKELGGLATDQDMGGAGHADHEAILTGLKPDTEYFYRLQGVAADGRLFQGEMLTFRTPAVTSSSGESDNLATGATVVDVSSEFSAAFGAANALDGDAATEWSSAGDGDDAFLTIDLGRQVSVTAVGFETRSMGDGSATASTFTVTVDGETYGPFDVGLAAVSFTGQVIRFDVESSTGGNTGASEIAVLGA